MAQNSFDVSTGADLQEVDNAVNQAMKEVATRYDFKGTASAIRFDRAAPALTLDAPDDFKLKALYDVLQTKLIRRQVPIRNLDAGPVQPASGGRVRQEVRIKQGIESDTAREIVKTIKAGGFKKVQAQIQGDEVRVTSPSKDELQQVITLLRAKDFGVELKFGNYRS